MFDFLKGIMSANKSGYRNGYKKNKELEAIISKIDSNVANNYKDAAQENLKAFEKRLAEMISEEMLSEKQMREYQNRLSGYKEKMKEFTHKDQKPYWT